MKELPENFETHRFNMSYQFIQKQIHVRSVETLKSILQHKTKKFF